MKKPNPRQYDTCAGCGARKRKTAKQCRRCNDKSRSRGGSHHSSFCSSCGWVLSGARQCPRCVYGVSMTWHQVSACYCYRNPDDPVPPQRCKAIVENVLHRLKMAVDRDTDVGRVLLGCLHDMAG